MWKPTSSSLGSNVNFSKPAISTKAASKCSRDVYPRLARLTIYTLDGGIWNKSFIGFLAKASSLRLNSYRLVADFGCILAYRLVNGQIQGAVNNYNYQSCSNSIQENKLRKLNLGFEIHLLGW